jgi:hypothetical protein
MITIKMRDGHTVKLSEARFGELFAEAMRDLAQDMGPALDRLAVSIRDRRARDAARASADKQRTDFDSAWLLRNAQQRAKTALIQDNADRHYGRGKH